MVCTLGLGQPSSSSTPSTPTLTSASTAQHLPQHLEAQRGTPSSSTPPSALHVMLAEAFDEFDDSSTCPATSATNAIPHQHLSPSTPSPDHFILDSISKTSSSTLFGAIDRIIAIFSSNDSSNDISAEPINSNLNTYTHRRNPITSSSTAARSLSPRSSPSAATATTTPPPSCAGPQSPPATTAPLDDFDVMDTFTQNRATPSSPTPRSSSFPLLLALWE